VADRWYGSKTMTAVDPTPPAAAKVPAADQPARGVRWLGAALAALGAVVMLGGLSFVYVHAKRFTKPPPPPTAAGVPVPLAPPKTAPPLPKSPAPPAASAPETHERALPFIAVPPFAEDRTALVPIVSNRPLWGPREAPVTVTVFGDLACPHTVSLLRALLGEKLRRGNDVRLAFRHFPLSQHEQGTRAAETLAAVYLSRGDHAFWSALAALLRHGGAVDAGVLENSLAAAELDVSPAELEAPAVKGALETDRVLGTSLYVRETPTVFVNGQRLEGYPSAPALKEVLDRELRASYLALASGVGPPALYRERTAKNLVNLGDDPPARTCVRAGTSPSRGPAAALVTVVEFSDLECELCRKGAESLRAALARHPSEVRAVWKHFPLPQHEKARYAASFALEARRLGREAGFFAVIDALLSPGTVLDDPTLSRAANRARLTPEALFAGAGSSKHDAAIDADIAEARALKVTGAPTYFVNGRVIAGALSGPELEAILREEIALARRVRSQGVGNVADLACGERQDPER
jgi:protein-disulfide isomerase